MIREENFELLKNRAIENYENYINVMKTFSYSDLNDLDNCLSLLESYSKAVISNCDLRGFINAARLARRVKKNEQQSINFQTEGNTDREELSLLVLQK
jgi:hypothetical protein